MPLPIARCSCHQPDPSRKFKPKAVSCDFFIFLYSRNERGSDEWFMGQKIWRMSIYNYHFHLKFVACPGVVWHALIISQTYTWINLILLHLGLCWKGSHFSTDIHPRVLCFCQGSLFCQKRRQVQLQSASVSSPTYCSYYELFWTTNLCITNFYQWSRLPMQVMESQSL